MQLREGENKSGQVNLKISTRFRWGWPKEGRPAFVDVSFFCSIDTQATLSRMAKVIRVPPW